MKYFSFIYKNILRNKRRTVLIFISIAFALFLYVFLFTVLSSMNKVMYRPGIMNIIFAGSTRYEIKHSDLPESYIAKVKTIPHVVDVNPCLQAFAYFEKSTKIINAWGIIPSKLKEIISITKIDGLSLDGLSQERTAALVGNDLMEEYHWEIGDRIIIKTGVAQEGIEFTIRGIVHGISNASYIIYLNLDYLQKILNNEGRVSFIYIKADNVDNVPEIIKNVETMFHNYPVEVFAFTQKSFMDSIVDKVKAILVAFRIIGCVAIISTFLLIATCISMSIRERTSEIGVLRVLGFSRMRIIVLVLAESTVVATCGGGLGSFLAYIFPIVYHIKIPATIPLHVASDFNFMYYGLFISFLIGILGGIFPLLNCVMVKPSEAIRSIG
jgi:putative ABC transport system permease protein